MWHSRTFVIMIFQRLRVSEIMYSCCRLEFAVFRVHKLSLTWSCEEGGVLLFVSQRITDIRLFVAAKLHATHRPSIRPFMGICTRQIWYLAIINNYYFIWFTSILNSVTPNGWMLFSLCTSWIILFYLINCVLSYWIIVTSLFLLSFSDFFA